MRCLKISLLISNSVDFLSFHMQKSRAWQEQTAGPPVDSFAENVVRESPWDRPVSREDIKATQRGHRPSCLRRRNPETFASDRIFTFHHITPFSYKAKAKTTSEHIWTSLDTMIYFSQLMSVLLALAFAILVVWLPVFSCFYAAYNSARLNYLTVTVTFVCLIPNLVDLLWGMSPLGIYCCVRDSEQKQCRKKGFAWLVCPNYTAPWMEARIGTQGRNSEVRTETEAKEELLLAWSA